MTTTGPSRRPSLGRTSSASRFGLEQSWGIEAYLANGGYEGLRKALAMTPRTSTRQRSPRASSGRGGAGFDAGRKWGMLRKAEPVYLVVNGDESEPATFKDHALMEGDPHQLIEGISSAPTPSAPPRCSSYVRGEMALAHERLQAALNEAYAYGAVGRQHPGLGFFGRHRRPPRRRRLHLRRRNGAARKPRGQTRLTRASNRPIYPAAIGLYGAPTVVNNVETLSNLPWIMRNGSDAFSALGEGRSRGTKLLSLSGHVRRPGNYEVEFAKVTFRDLIYDATARRRHQGGPRAQGDYPRRGLVALVRPRPPGRVPGQRSDRRGRFDGRLGSHHGHGRDDLHGAGRVADHPLLPSGIVRPVHAVPGRLGLGSRKIMRRIEDGEGREADLDLLMDVCDNISPGVHLAAGADDDLPSRARRSRARWRRASACSATSSWTTSARPLPLPTRPAASEPRLCLTRCRRASKPAPSRPRGDRHAAGPSRRARRRHHHPRRAAGDGQEGRAAHRRRRAGRDVHPPFLLPPPDEAGRDVPDVPRRREGPAGLQPFARLLLSTSPRAWRPSPTARR